MRKRIFVPLLIGLLLSLISNSVAIEIVYNLITAEILKDVNLFDYIGRLLVSTAVTLWLAVMVAIFLYQDRERQAEIQNYKEKLLLYTNKESGLRNAPWLDYVLSTGKDPVTGQEVKHDMFCLHTTLWWQAFSQYCDEGERTQLLKFLVEQIVRTATKDTVIGYLGNGVFYTFTDGVARVAINDDYAEFDWNSYNIAVVLTPIGTPTEYNSYQFVSLSRSITENIEAGTVPFKDVGTVAKKRSASMPEAWAALRENHIEFVYQPIHEFSTANISSFEMLARLKDKKNGFISMSDEIAMLLESSPFSLRFHQLLFERLLEAQEKLQIGSHDLAISINIPASIISRPSFWDIIERAVSAGLNLSQIAFELTERTLPSGSKAIRDSLSALRALGASIHLDDFGSGQSSIETISFYEFDIVKLDREFILGTQWSPEKASSLIAYLHNLNVKVLVEGIEEKSFGEFFAAAGAEFVQGYAYSKPMSLEKACKLGTFEDKVC
jgi:EAL domain-containing protein (putative c-di-GMP-specific phosphodiesterase class I)